MTERPREVPAGRGATAGGLAARCAVTVALAALVLSPVAAPEGWDSFPISRFPMFARGRLGRVHSLAHGVLVHADGSRSPVTPAMVGSREPMIALSVFWAHVDRGTAAELCVRVAARAPGDVVAVEIVTSTFDARRYFSDAPGAREPLVRGVHARCEVPR